MEYTYKNTYNTLTYQTICIYSLKLAQHDLFYDCVNNVPGMEGGASETNFGHKWIDFW